ncbi:restriction endonuclease subunit S [Streptomyces sp. DSM 41634]|uniref:restriction endonuclease subunit S n=1 Tax=Streptomyces sp. DSM 41634 TaxID=3448656 RepID=UPI00288416BA|nr:restriction endonuclease subunit S [Streptomyces sp. DSM 41633]
MNIVRLRHLAQVNPLTPAFDRLAHEDELTFLPMEAVWPGSRLDISRRRTKASVATGYTRFQDGDVLVPKITPTFEAGRAVLIGGLLGGVGAGTTELHVVRPGPQIEPRFLLHVVNTHSFLKLGEAEMYGVAGQQRVPDSFLRDVPLELPSLEEQRRIADFLDAETARIDGLNRATRHQQQLVTERQDVAFHDSVQGEGGPDLNEIEPETADPAWRMLPLNHALNQLTNGYVGPTRDLFVDDGVRYLQSLHIKNGRIDFARKPYFVTQEWAAERPRIRLGFEDLLIVQTGAIGEVGLVDEEYAGASCHALLIARTNRSILAPRYLWHAFRSHWGRSALLREQTGALHPHLEAGNVRFMKVPVPALDTQLRVVARTEEISKDTLAIEHALSRRLRLQSERRQALITAAVTGQFDVSTASGRNVTDGVTA